MNPSQVALELIPTLIALAVVATNSATPNNKTRNRMVYPPRNERWVAQAVLPISLTILRDWFSVSTIL